MTVVQLYRGILKMLPRYPSVNRDQFREAIMEEFHIGKHLTEDLEIRKARKKAKMLYAHILMYDIKMQELRDDSTEKLDKPMEGFKDINHKDDDDFVYF